MIDARYEVRERGFRIPWGSLFWRSAYAMGFTAAAVEYRDSVAAIGMLFFAAVFLGPIWRLFSLAMAPQLPEQEALQLRRRLVGGWEQAEAQRASRSRSREAGLEGEPRR